MFQNLWVMFQKVSNRKSDIAIVFGMPDNPQIDSNNAPGALSDPPVLYQKGDVSGTISHQFRAKIKNRLKFSS
jgi:hypothetical protein